MNSVNLLGRIANDTEVRVTPSGISVLTFRLAVDRPPSKDGEREADFITCVAWRQTAEFINKYFIKGSMIGISGKLRTRQYEDSRYSDVTHYATEVYVDSAYFTGQRAAQSAQSEQTYAERNGSKQSGYNPPAPPKRQESKPASPEPAIGTLDDFEEIISDGNVPF